jgi:hypothetical protein
VEPSPEIIDVFKLVKLFVEDKALGLQVNVGVVALAEGAAIIDKPDPAKTEIASNEINFLNIIILKLSERIPINTPDKGY